MHEIVINLHMHTCFSDGHGSHADIAHDAIKTGLDAIIVTDHNVFVKGPEGYFAQGDRRVLVMIGEEIHDQIRDPQKNHLLAFGHNKEFSQFAEEPQQLIYAIHRVGGLTFLAHPVDPAAPVVGQSDISWVDWDVQGYTGVELWNGFSEFKSRLKSKLHAFFYAYFPNYIAFQPPTDMINIWDKLLATGKQVVAIAGSDAHALHIQLGPLRRIVFPYEYHFRSINTHLYLPQKLSGDAISDTKLILDGIAAGRCFLANDMPASARGFRFIASGTQNTCWMGDRMWLNNGVTIQIHLPKPAECILLKDGKAVKTWKKQTVCTYVTRHPGVYRVEAYISFLGQRRGWIYSNPIYLDD